MKKLIIARRCSQLFFLAFFIYVLWSTTYPLKGLFSPEIFFKIDPLIMLLTALSERILLPGLIFALAMILLTLVLGRFFCGWVCPLGTLIDGAGAFKAKKILLTDAQNAKVRRFKFFLLGLMALSALAGVQVAWIFDPIVIIARVVSLNVIPAVTLAVDKFFIALIKNLGLYGGVYDFYQTLKASFLGINVHFFTNSLVTFIVFLVIILISLKLARLWCRALCPLGAVYALAAGMALLERKTDGCTHCGLCRSRCRMGAITGDFGYNKGECILCMDCVYDCPPNKTRFSWRRPVTAAGAQDRPSSGISRKQFVFLLCSSLSLLGAGSRPDGKKGVARNVIRPPGALPEKQFLNTCVRCGNCMKVCVTNGLQPILLEAGPQGIWTPQLVPEIGYCEYHCTLCGSVCPTGAIPRLTAEEKRKARLGVAEIDRSLCIAWAENKQCIVCEEHCPVADKAIKVREVMVDGRRVLKPYVDENLCVGCGICQNKCPVSPTRAIRVKPV